jgi:hypothetical protein
MSVDRFADVHYTAWHAEQDGVLDEYLEAKDLPAVGAPPPAVSIQDIRNIVPASLAVIGRRHGWEIAYTDHNWRRIESIRVAYDAPVERLAELRAWVQDVMTKRPRIGRPEIGPQVKVRLPEDVIAKIDGVRDGISRSEWIRRAIIAALD